MGSECGTSCHPFGAVNVELAVGYGRMCVPCINTILKFTLFKNIFYFDKENRVLTSVWYRVYDEWSYTKFPDMLHGMNRDNFTFFFFFRSGSEVVGC